MSSLKRKLNQNNTIYRAINGKSLKTFQDQITRIKILFNLLTMKLCFYLILILETVCNFSVASEPKAKLHFAIDGNHIGNIKVNLFNDTVPKTVNNFLALGNGNQCV